MKQFVAVVAAVLVSAGLCFGQGMSVGAHGGYTVGGDIEESGFAFGAQAGYELNENLSVELAWTRFSDEETSEGFKLEADADVLAATVRYGFPMSDTVTPYVGAGVNYLMIDAEVSMQFTSEEQAELQAMADAFGLTVDQLLQELGIESNSESLDLDNTIGFHICGGANIKMTEVLQLFAEYRYSFGTVKGDGIDEDFDCGIARVGVNLLL